MSVLQTNWRLFGHTSVSGALTQPMQSALTAGTRLIAALSFETPTVSAVTVTDDHNGAYHLDADSGALAGSAGAGGGRIMFFSVPNTLSGSQTLTATAAWTSTSDVLFSWYEVSGGVTFDAAGTAKSGAGTLTALGFSILPAGVNEFVVAAALSNSNAGIAVDSGYSFPTSNQTGDPMPDGGTIDWHCHEYIASATGTQNLTFNGTGSGGASMFAAAYGTGASPPPSVSSLRFFDLGPG